MGSKMKSKAVPGQKNRAYIRRLESLINASQLLNSTLKLDNLLQLILELALKNLNAARGTIYLLDFEKKELWSKVLKGEELVEIRLPIGTGIAGHVAKSGKTVHLKDAWKDKRFFSGFDIRTGFQTKTMLCMPMRNRKGKVIGVFQIINKKRGSFSREDELFLEAYSDHAAIAIENAYLHQAIVEKEIVEKEIQIAATIQKKLLPKELPQIEGYDLSAFAFPCKAIGGDFYDIIHTSDVDFVFVVADVSGKGIPAALLVSTLHASLHAYIQTSISLEDLVFKLNRMVYKNTPSDRYITFFVAVLDAKRNSLKYVNAGHNFPILFRLGQKEFSRLDVGGIPLGMFEEAEYTSATLTLDPGDRIFLYTDGITEAMNRRFEEYGEERFRTCIRELTGTTASEAGEAIFHDINQFTASEPQSDDITLMVLNRKEIN